jgi:hypothetical protein
VPASGGPTRADDPGAGDGDTHGGGTRGEAPRPGDPRDPGPRPAAQLRDLWWGALAVTVSVVTAVQVLGLAVALVRLDPGPTTGGLVLGFLVTVVWLLTIWWLVVGAWRRSVWGCPFSHTIDAPAARRCPRHAPVV